MVLYLLSFLDPNRKIRSFRLFRYLEINMLYYLTSGILILIRRIKTLGSREKVALSIASFNKGFADYVSKPVEIRELLSTVGRHLPDDGKSPYDFTHLTR